MCILAVPFWDFPVMKSMTVLMILPLLQILVNSLSSRSKFIRAACMCVWAFAVNIMSQAYIMVVDEALSVGDMKFRAKCMTALKQRQEAGTTVLFVSHDIGSIKSLCSRGIYLEHGEMKSIGTAAEVAERYLRMMREEMNDEQHSFKSDSSDYCPIGKESNTTDIQSVQRFCIKEIQMNLTAEYLNFDMEQAKRVLPMSNCSIWMMNQSIWLNLIRSVKIRILF